MKLFEWLSKRLTDFIGERDLGAPTFTAPLYCPRCRAQHVDEGVWAERPHYRHLCAYCRKHFRVEPYTFGSADPGAHDPLEQLLNSGLGGKPEGPSE
jgi:transposase-like protein